MVDTIILFESTEIDFTSNGIGNLPDAIKCEVVEERNGRFELSMTYPKTGYRYEEIKLRRILVAKPNPYSDPQPFRIYYISKPINGQVAIKAEHLHYDLSGIPTSTFEVSSVSTALATLIGSGQISHNFVTWTNKTNAGAFKVTEPCSALSRLGGVEGSIIDVYGGEYEWDKWIIKLWDSRGHDNGVIIEYGKNLTDLTQEEKCSNVYTGVYPYWKGSVEEETTIIELPEKVVPVSGAFNYTKILTLDLSSEWQEAPTFDQLRTRTNRYISDNNIGVPDVSLSFSFVTLRKCTEYEQYSVLEDVHLCDTITVRFPDLGVNATSKVIKTTYDVITDSYTNIEVGSTKSQSLVDTIAFNTRAVSEVPSSNELRNSQLSLGKTITGGYGGKVRFHYPDGSDEPDEIIILDNPDIYKAKNVWRWNQNGLAFSNNGYFNETSYIVGMTADGKFNADLIRVGLIKGDVIESGSLDISQLNNFQQIVMRADIEGFADYIDVGNLWQHFDPETGFWIGRLDSNFAVNITNTQMSFVELDGSDAVTVTTSRSQLRVSQSNIDILTKFKSKAGTYILRYLASDNTWYLDSKKIDLFEYGITIISGQPVNNDAITINITNNFSNGIVVAYIRYNKLMIEDTHVKERLIFGKNETNNAPEEQFAFIPNNNGSLKFKWIGS